MSSENSGLNIPELKSIQQLQSLKCSLGPHELKNETKNAAREETPSFGLAVVMRTHQCKKKRIREREGEERRRGKNKIK